MRNISVAAKAALLGILCASAAVPSALAAVAPKDWTFTIDESAGDHAMGLTPKDVTRFSTRSSRDFPLTTIPDKMDLRDQISPIQNQAKCGSCWAFSLTATARDSLLLAGKDPGDLSQQYLVDCAENDNGCSGGYFDAADSLIRPKGAPSQADYPYTAKDGTCQNKPVKGSILAWHMIGSGSGPSTRDIEAVMTARHAPVSAVVAAGAGHWKQYSSGVYNECAAGAQMDHMINIVGWDNEGAAFDSKGSLPPGKGVWIVRNSWGATWGEKGWMRIKMTDAQGNLCSSLASVAAYFDVVESDLFQLN